MRVGGVAALIFMRSKRWKRVANFTPSPLYRGKEHRYPSKRRPSVPKARSNILKNRKYSFSLYRFEPLIVKSVDYALYCRHLPGSEFDLC